MDKQHTKGWCGYCHLMRLEALVKDDEDWTVTVQPSTDDVGYDVFLHPVDVAIPPLARHIPEYSLKFWKTWLFSDYRERGCWC